MNGELVKKKAVRKSGPKVKTGCTTCKIRRVKCDEAKPKCLRCTRLRLECEGYTSLVTPQRIDMPRLPPNFQPIFYQPSTTWIQSHEENQFFTYFIDTMAPQLAGHAEHDLWNRLILQACQDDTAVRHVVIAMAASKSAADVAQSSKGAQALDAQKQHQYALRQYAKAIRTMRDAAVHDRQSLRSTLITSLLIFCFEMLHGNHDAAVKQVLIGLGLIDEYPRDHHIPEVEDELISAFTRLDIQTMSFADPRPPTRHAFLKDHVLAPLPHEFRSLEQAQMYLEPMVQRMMHLMASITPDTKFVGCLKLNLLKSIPDSLFHQRDAFLADYDKWFAAFQPLKKAGSPTAKSLELIYLTSYFATAVIRNAQQTAPDTHRFMPMLKDIVDLARSLITAEKEHGKGVFRFSMQVICPLYAVAWRCPQRTLRREAIELLLSSPRREGLWDSVLAGRLAEWIMLCEEENIDDDEEYVPDHLRSTGIDIMRFGDMERRMRIRCLLPHKETLEWMVRETVISW